MDKKQRMVTKYVTEAFGLLLLTDSFSCMDHLQVFRGDPWAVRPLPPSLGRTLPPSYQVRKLTRTDFSDQRNTLNSENLKRIKKI